jgi:hypothetical protein
LQRTAQNVIDGAGNLVNYNAMLSIGSQGAIAAGTGGQHKMEARSASAADAAFMGFHKINYAAYFGIDTDNQWKVGGWSMGAASYRLLHEANAFVIDGAGNLNANGRALYGLVGLITQYEREAKTVLGNVSAAGTALPWLNGLVTATITAAGATFTHQNLPNGAVGYLVVSLTNGGVATSVATLFPGVKWPGGAGTYSLSAAGRDEITLRCHDGATVDVVGFAKGMG